MAANWVHQVLALIAFGFPYAEVHRRKDSHSRVVPGQRHRMVRHRKYGAFGTGWDWDTVFAEPHTAQINRIGRWKGSTLAEMFMVSAAHDVDDRVWDYPELSRQERAFQRKCVEGFCAWLVFNPAVLRSWAQVDVLGGRIHRVIDGVEVWELEPALIPAYERLLRFVKFVYRRDWQLRQAVEACDRLHEQRALSNKPLHQPSGARAFR